MIEMKSILLICLVLFVIHSQPTNFNYTQHGKYWPGDCSKNLSQQSPIVLPAASGSSKSSYIFCDFHPTPTTATILNTTIYLKPTSSLQFFGQLYTQLINSQKVPFKAFQIRLRVGSQHRIDDGKDGKQYDMQVQISFKQLYDSSKNIKLNLGLFYQVTQTTIDPFLQQIINNAKDINQNFNINVDLSYILNRYDLWDFWFYQGSSTMPQCNNGKLSWIVSKKIFQMTQKQLDFFRNYYPDGNWRQVQPINGNQIGYANTGFKSNGQM